MDSEDDQIRFFNVDLDIESRVPIDKIIQEFNEKVSVLYQQNDADRHIASFEITLGDDDPESIIRSFCSLIHNLSEQARKQWDACDIKNFDIGYGSGIGSKAYQTIIHHEVITAVAKLGGAIAITIYPVYDKSTPAAQSDPLD